MKFRRLDDCIVLHTFADIDVHAVGKFGKTDMGLHEYVCVSIRTAASLTAPSVRGPWHVWLSASRGTVIQRFNFSRSKFSDSVS